MNLSQFVFSIFKRKPVRTRRSPSQTEMVAVRASTDSAPILIPVPVKTASQSSRGARAGRGDSPSGVKIARPSSGLHQDLAAEARETLSGLTGEIHMSPEEHDMLQSFREGKSFQEIQALRRTPTSKTG